MEEYHELRWNPLLNSWVIVSNVRKFRPWRPSSHCPFCPGAPEAKFKSECDTLALPNKYPTLITNPKISRKSKGLFRLAKGYGYAEVLVETPQHEGDLCDIPLRHMKKVVEGYIERTLKLGSDPKVKYVAVFRNKGAAVGVSLTHPHSQIYALPFIPPRIRLELRNARRYWRRNGRCLFCDLLKEELSEKQRIIYRNDFFTAFLPFYAMWPYEIHIYSNNHIGGLPELNEEEKLHLADILKAITKTYNTLFEMDFPYIMAVHQSPTDGKRYEYYHLHIEFYPPLRSADKLKYAAGIEWGYFTFTYDDLPEEKAKELRRAAYRAVEDLSRTDKVLGEAPFGE